MGSWALPLGRLAIARRWSTSSKATIGLAQRQGELTAWQRRSAGLPGGDAAPLARSRRCSGKETSHLWPGHATARLLDDWVARPTAMGCVRHTGSIASHHEGSACSTKMPGALSAEHARPSAMARAGFRKDAALLSGWAGRAFAVEKPATAVSAFMTAVGALRTGIGVRRTRSEALPAAPRARSTRPRALRAPATTPWSRVGALRPRDGAVGVPGSALPAAVDDVSTQDSEPRAAAGAATGRAGALLAGVRPARLRVRVSSTRPDTTSIRSGAQRVLADEFSTWLPRRGSCGRWSGRRVHPSGRPVEMSRSPGCPGRSMTVRAPRTSMLQRRRIMRVPRPCPAVPPLPRSPPHDRSRAAGT
jgi:hypothetical protein